MSNYEYTRQNFNLKYLKNNFLSELTSVLGIQAIDNPTLTTSSKLAILQQAIEKLTKIREDNTKNNNSIISEETFSSIEETFSNIQKTITQAISIMSEEGQDEITILLYKLDYLLSIYEKEISLSTHHQISKKYYNITKNLNFYCGPQYKGVDFYDRDKINK